MAVDGPGARQLTAETMGPLFRSLFPEERFVVVSNREPYEHRLGEAGEVVVRRPAGGLTSALDPLMQAVGGVWVAWGSGNADRGVVDTRQGVRVPPEEPAYRLRRVWLNQQDVDRYYLGFSNQFLWPLCHYRPALTRVRGRYWERYRDVNQRFAKAVLEEIGQEPSLIWFQDYHLALAPRYVRAERPEASLAHFWHIPWPPVELFRVAPQAEALLGGLLANDLLAFHLPSYVTHFLHAAERMLDAEIDWENWSASYGGQRCFVRAFPISIDVETCRAKAQEAVERGSIERLRAKYAPRDGLLGVGVDRMDYSKGLPEKLKALDLLWERHPDMRGRLSFIQVAVPSRTDIDAYDELNQRVERLVWEINDRYGTPEWRPVHLIRQALSQERLAVLYRASDFCIVASLQDGMNLVAKEYAISQLDGAGVLLLSRFAGAAEVVEGHWEVNPYDPEDFAAQIRLALEQPYAVRRANMERLQHSIRTIFDWLAETFESWSRIAHGAVPPLDARSAEEALSVQARQR
jgi:trehalose 6-phosphate synthase/phosphatase